MLGDGTGSCLPRGTADRGLRRACKADRSHAVIVVDGDGRPIRSPVASAAASTTTAVARRTARWRATAPRSRARAAGDPFPLVSERERVASPMKLTTPVAPADLEWLLRRIIREETGIHR